MPPWLIPAIVSAIGIGVVLIVNLLVIGRWVGSIGTAQANLTGMVAKLERRLDDFEDEVEGEAAFRSGFEERLKTVERAADAFWDVRDLVTGMRAAGEVEARITRETLERLGREVGGVHRALAHMTWAPRRTREPVPGETR